MHSRRTIRFLLYALLLAAVIFFFNIVKNWHSTVIPRFDLRKEHELSIIPPVLEPRGIEQDLVLLVIISSSPSKEHYAERREIVRKVWGTYSRTHSSPNEAIHKWKTVFMMGKTFDKEKDELIMAEQEKYGDLLVGDYKDTYRNITIKLLMALQWASKIRCKYILKTDDDVYINVPKLITWLVTRGGNSSSLYGGVLYQGIVVRDKSHRHYVRKEVLPIDYYPVFCKGAMFIMSWNLVPKVVELSKQISRISPDDAYIGLLVYHLGIAPTSIPGFVQKSYLHWFVSFISSCQFKDIIGIGDSLTPRQVLYVHQQIASVSARETFTFCVSLHMKFWLLIFFCAVTLACLCCGRRNLLCFGRRPHKE